MAPTDTTGFDFHLRLDLLDDLLESLQRIVIRTLSEFFDCIVKYFFGSTFLAVIHHLIHELCSHPAPVFRIREHFTLWRGSLCEAYVNLLVPI